MKNLMPKMEPRIYLSEADCPGMCTHLMTSLTINLFWKDRERKFLGANKGFLEVYGISDVKDIIGKTDEDMGWHIDDDLYRKEEEAVIFEGKSSVGVFGKCIIHGVVHDIVATKEPYYRDGEIAGLFGYFLDLGESAGNLKPESSESAVDSVTGVMSAMGLMHALADYMEKWEEKKENFVTTRICWSNMDDFVEKYGKKKADELLKEWGKIVINALKNRAVGARIGDRYFVLVEKYGTRESMWNKLYELQKVLLEAYHAHNYEGEPTFQAKVFPSEEMRDRRELIEFAMLPKNVSDKLSYQKQLMTDEIVKNIPAALVIFAMTKDNRSSIIYMSDMVKKLFGSKVEQADGISIVTDRVVPKEEERRIRAAGWESLTYRRPFDEVFQIETESGERVWCHFVTEPVMQPNGDCLFYGVYTDITTQKREEDLIMEKQKDKLRKYQEALSRVNDTTNPNLAMRAHFDYTDNVLMENWYSAKNGGLSMPSDTTIEDFKEKALEHAFSEADRQKLRDAFQFDRVEEYVERNGNFTARVEYLRNAETGRTYWTSTEFLVLQDPETDHIHLYFSIYNAAQELIPADFTQLMVTKDYEIFGLYNLIAKKLQRYDLELKQKIFVDTKPEYEKGCKNYAEQHLDPEDQEKFLWNMNIRNIQRELETRGGEHQISFWTNYEDEVRRKVWKFRFADEEHNYIIIARMDITDTYVDEEKYIDQISEMSQEIEIMNRDVTGVYTRKATLQKIRSLMESPKEGSYGLIMCDLDRLKEINDNYGHQIGDMAISTIATALQNVFRKNDVVGRIGGDEFMVFCDSAEVAILEAKTREVLKQINAYEIVPEEHRTLGCSIGVFAGTYGEESFEEAYSKVDSALYASKKNGRNRITKYEDIVDSTK